MQNIEGKKKKRGGGGVVETRNLYLPVYKKGHAT